MKTLETQFYHQMSYYGAHIIGARIFKAYFYMRCTGTQHLETSSSDFCYSLPLPLAYGTYYPFSCVTFGCCGILGCLLARGWMWGRGIFFFSGIGLVPGPMGGGGSSDIVDVFWQRSRFFLSLHNRVFCFLPFVFCHVVADTNLPRFSGFAHCT